MMIKIPAIYALFMLAFMLTVNAYQLNGLTDSGFYIEPIYRFFYSGRFDIAIFGGIDNFLSAHFSPFWLLFSPLAGLFPNPVLLVNVLFFIAYTASLVALHRVYLGNTANYKTMLLLFLLFISIPAVLFNFNFNFNGLHSVLFAPVFLIPAYYHLFIADNAKKALLWYLPLLTIKEEFWLLGIFFSFALFFRYREYRYILLTLLFAVAFYLLYFKVMASLHNGEGTGVLSGHYSYLFEAKNFNELLNALLGLGYWERRVAFILLFFLPFMIVIKIKRITFKDWLTAIIIIGPTLGYCLLSQQTPMNYWLFEHYSLPVLPVLIILMKKYGSLSIPRLIVFFVVNVLLIVGVISQKQPWQYKYYQDEAQLSEKILPLLKLNHEDFILADDRTGIYFTPYQVDYLRFIRKGKNKNKNAKYIIINTRYTYSAANLKYTGARSVSTYEYLTSKALHDYKSIYESYPFIVLTFEKEAHFFLDQAKFDRWDLRTRASNEW